MALETKTPNAILSQTGNTGVVGDIQDSPDSPDANWLVATGNNTHTDVNVSFATPTGNPTTGADLQEFRALVRPFDSGQTGDPNARIELWENGALIRAGSETALQNAGGDIVIAFTWNASELATADGSLVEGKAVGTKTSGSGSKRNTVDIGAIEWNVEYDTGEEEEVETVVYSGSSYHHARLR